jgi:uncharacterized protein
MNEPSFEWDETKDRRNQRVHGIAFREAATVFRDEAALMEFDSKHSSEEDRFVLLGLSASMRLLVVCHCYQERLNIIRIFSARRATKKERRQYEDRRS